MSINTMQVASWSRHELRQFYINNNIPFPSQGGTSTLRAHLIGLMIDGVISDASRATSIDTGHLDEVKSEILAEMPILEEDNDLEIINNELAENKNNEEKGEKEIINIVDSDSDNDVVDNSLNRLYNRCTTEVIPVDPIIIQPHNTNEELFSNLQEGNQINLTSFYNWQEYNQINITPSNILPI